MVFSCLFTKQRSFVLQRKHLVRDLMCGETVLPKELLGGSRLTELILQTDLHKLKAAHTA